MKLLHKIITAGLLLIASTTTFAGLGPQVILVDGGGNRTETKGYAGLAWTLGSNKKSSVTPEVVVGVRSVRVKANDRVTNGADLSARFSLVDGFSFDSVRLSYVGGTRNTLGNVGVGYSFSSNSVLSTFAVQAPYLRLGMDYDFSSSKIIPYIDVLSLGKPKRVNSSQYACNPELPFVFLPENPQEGDFCEYRPPN